MRYTWLFIIPPIAIAIIIFVAWYQYRLHSHDRDLRRVAVIAHTKTIKMLPAYRKAMRRYRLLMACAIVCFLAAVFSLTAVAARPISRQERDTSSENRDVVLCMDVSGSMRYYQKELLSYFKDIVSSLRGQRISVTIFDGKPANLIPLTDDYDALIEIIDSLSSSFSEYRDSTSLVNSNLVIGSSSSAIGDGVMGCVNSLDLSDSNLRTKSIIIATDNDYGPNSQSIDIMQVARYAEQYGVTFYGIHVPYISAQQKKIEFMEATRITNGSFYSLDDYYDIDYTKGVAESRKDAKQTIRSIIDEIMAQETEKMKGAPEIIYTDQPNIMLYVSGISFALFALIIWRLRL